jgi:hypothetical protein
MVEENMVLSMTRFGVVAENVFSLVMVEITDVRVTRQISVSVVRDGNLLSGSLPPDLVTSHMSILHSGEREMPKSISPYLNA